MTEFQFLKNTSPKRKQQDFSRRRLSHLENILKTNRKIIVRENQISPANDDVYANYFIILDGVVQVTHEKTALKSDMNYETNIDEQKICICSSDELIFYTPNQERIKIVSGSHPEEWKKIEKETIENAIIDKMKVCMNQHILDDDFIKMDSIMIQESLKNKNYFRIGYDSKDKAIVEIFAGEPTVQKVLSSLGYEGKLNLSDLFTYFKFNYAK